MATASSSAAATASAAAPPSEPARPTTEHDAARFSPVPDGSVSATPSAITHQDHQLDLRRTPVSYTDGRVRNPIPSKLKGKTDEKKGNFNVMHMEIQHSSESQARYDAAKRNSENTALQAKLAETDHYVSHHRRANYQRARPTKPLTIVPPPPTNQATATATTTTTTELTHPVSLQSHSLTPAETKEEQARLLTLLRGLSPATVVDQICKALAFFGGIPDAPPPADGKFPESDEANGSGSLFVGWIAEIFPRLDRPRRVATLTPAPPSKRPRGRPKGSKATKARRDKGVKKGSKKANQDPALAAQAPDQHEGHDESWVDVEDSVMEVDGTGDHVERRVLSLLETPSRDVHDQGVTATPATGSTTGFTSINNVSTEPRSTASTAKRRGRPKGSKNRPKEGTAQETLQQPSFGATAPNAAADTQVAAVPVPMGDGVTSKKAGSKRPRSSKKSKTDANTMLQNNDLAQPQPNTSFVPHPTIPGATTISSAANVIQSSTSGGDVSGESQSAYVPAKPAISYQNTQLATPQVKESTITGVKRKRQSNKNSNVPTNGIENPRVPGADGDRPQPSTSATSLASSGAVPLPQPDQMSLVSGTSSMRAPPAKRSRKSASAGAKRDAIPTAVNNMNSPEVAKPDQVRPQTLATEDTAQSRPPAEGLAAHYAKIAALEAQNDPTQSYVSPQQQPQQRPATGNQLVSPRQAESSDSQYNRYGSLQNRPVNNAQVANSRQQAQQYQQPNAQSTSPTPSQVSKAPPLSATFLPHQQPRTSNSAANYYSPNKTSAYTTQQGSYMAHQRTGSMSTSSPGTSLASRVTHSPQVGVQSNNSPLMGTENAFRGSPSMGINPSSSFAPRRTPSTSSMESNYRATGGAPHGLGAPPSHYGRQTSTSHSGIASSFPPYSDTTYLEIPGLDSTTDHNSLGLANTGTYGLGGGNVQRANSGSGAVYTNMTNGYDSTGLNRGTINTSYRGPNRWQ